MLREKTGYFLIALTAIVSGFSIFLNKFAVSGLNPFVFTALKNTLVAVFLFSVILLLKEFNALKILSRKNWLKLAAIGLIGGSIPFLLFFYALKLTSAVNAGFLHKTLFVFASLFALVFLKERLSRRWLIAAGLLLLGNFFMFNFVSGFALADLLVLGAVLFWAAENVLSKHILKELSGRIVAFGRMFFGSAFLLLFLVFSNQISLVASLTVEQWQWTLLVSVPLLFYVLTFYSGLKYVPVSRATMLLMLGQPITMGLSAMFLGKEISFNQAIGIVFILTGILLVFASSYALAFLRSKGFLIAESRN